MRIGSVALPNITVLAPLAGINHLPFRLLAKSCGCGLICAEMVSANGLAHRSPKTLRMLAIDPRERPISIQIFGSEPAIIAEAAGMVADAGADILDINFGCSVKKVVRTGAGVALMRQPGLAAAVIRAARRAVSIPLTIKIRTGWDRSGEQALTLARIAEEEGADAIAAHPRTAVQGFSGHADWSLIRRIKESIAIPVIGNGDIATAEDARRMLAETGCDAVMVGRAAIGYPWIFDEIRALLENRPPPTVDPETRLNTMIQYLDEAIADMGEAHACRMMRSRLGWFAKGMPGGSRFRESIHRIETRAEAMERIESFRSALISHLPFPAAHPPNKPPPPGS